MKILLIHCTYKFRGGEDTVVEEEMKLLQGHGEEVNLLSFSNDKNMLWKLIQLPFNVSAYLKTKKKLRAWKPDIVHIHNLHFGGSPSVIYAIKHSGIPFVMTVHNYRLLCPSAILFYKGKPFLESIRQPFPIAAVKAGVYKNSRLLTLWIGLSMLIHHWMRTWECCSRFIVLSQHTQNIFMHSKMRFRNEQIVVKPNFSAFPKLESSKRGDYFLFVGRLSEEKGIRLLLQVFSALPHHLKIAGDGPLRDEVINYSSLFPNIEFIGSLPKEEVITALQHCTALVFPSIWFEGMPLTIIEAFGSGTPVIASKLGAMENMITPGFDGLHFECGNTDSLKASLIQWVQLREQDKMTMRKNARFTYEEYYTPGTNIKQLLGIYQSVTGVKEMGTTSIVSTALVINQLYEIDHH